MLTRNFLYAIGSPNSLNCDNVPLVVPIDNVEVSNIRSQSFTLAGFSSSNYWQKAKFVIGTGSTAPKSTDYKLENEITEGYDCGTLSKRHIQGKEKDCLNIYGMITNTGTVDLSFSEIGLYVNCSIESIGEKTFLIAREVYDTPITIAPGESVSVNVNIM